MSSILVSGSFDDLRSPQVRLLHEASRLGAVQVLLWSDAQLSSVNGRPPKFRLEERRYLLEAIRCVRQVTVAEEPFDPDTIPGMGSLEGRVWAVGEADDRPARRAFAAECGLEYRVIPYRQLQGFPAFEEPAPPGSTNSGEADPGPPNRKVLVSGCFDWFHSGHVRFFEEVSALGELFVVLGHDANVRLLKGEGHPLFPQEERRYLVQAVRHVKQALISTGGGWLDAEPEIEALRPDIYAVNEDGDKPEKREYCARHGIEYMVLKRTPKQGLPRRQSTTLRGF
jgi:cytidyltransferase-like protein